MNTVLNEMLDLIERKRVAERETLLAQARDEARTLVAGAHRKARERVREVVIRERRLLEQAKQSLLAQEETEQRHHAMRVVQRRLDQARTLLDQALLERWRQPDSRRIWIDALLERALVFLPVGAWEIHHPESLDPEEWRTVERRVLAAGLPPPIPEPDAGLRAGLRLGCRGAWLDGSAAGLVANRLAIDAGLLALMHAEGASS
ncbi:MAG: hypothetical protein HQM00_02115 [Magnetococcales bacterium]|nr:hypothetical protein [Magnetococcales bacterium]